MKPESDLLKAARVFTFITGGILDGAQIGKIYSTPIYAGEVRRLNAAIEAEDAARQDPDPAGDGPEVGLIRFFQLYPDGDRYSIAVWGALCDFHS
jgi:hypothetical protein